MFGFFRPQLGKENTTACDGGSASFNTATVVALNHTTQGNVIRNSVISHISVHFPAWQLPEKSTEDQNSCWKKCCDWWKRSTHQNKSLGGSDGPECERRRSKYSSYIYLWALLKSRWPDGPQQQWMRSFWEGTEWAIHKLLPCTNTGHTLNPICKP